MITQTNSKYIPTLSDVKRAAEVKFRIKQLGLTQKEIAKELGVKPALICMVINSTAKSSRVTAWLKENLGV